MGIRQNGTRRIRQVARRLLPGSEDILDRRNVRQGQGDTWRESRGDARCGLRLHRPAGNARRACKDTRLQNLPWPPKRDIQRRTPGRFAQARGKAHRYGSRKPLSLPRDCRQGRRDARDGAHEYRYRRPLHGESLGEELLARNQKQGNALI